MSRTIIAAIALTLATLSIAPSYAWDLSRQNSGGMNQDQTDTNRDKQ